MNSHKEVSTETTVDYAVARFRSINIKISDQLLSGEAVDSEKMRVLLTQHTAATQQLDAARKAEEQPRDNSVYRLLGKVGVILGITGSPITQQSIELVHEADDLYKIL